MERRPCGSNRDSTSRRISCRNEEELGTSDKGNEEVIRQEKVESSRTKGQRKRVAGKQEYSFESTLKEVG